MKKSFFRTREFTIFVVIVAMVIFFSVFSKRFLAPNNIKNIFLQMSAVGVASIGMTLIIATGGIDVSAGSIVGIVAAIIGKLILLKFPVYLAVLLGIIGGTLLGSVNGALVSYLGIPPIIVTLGMMSFLRSMVYNILGGKWISTLPENIRWIGVGTILGIPVPIFILFVLLVYFTYFTRFRVTGRYIYAVGNSVEASIVSGVPVRKILFMVYTIGGFLYAIACLIILGRAGVIQTNTGSGFELQVIAATVLGGTSVLGGKGTVIGSFLGSLFVAVLSNGLIIMNVPALMEGLIIGGLILGSVVIDILRTRGEA